MGAVEPRPDERQAGRRLALGDLVLVVREDEVHAAGVDVERRSEVGMLIAEHSMCQPGRPARWRCPTRLAGLAGPSTARSRGRRPCRSRRPRPARPRAAPRGRVGPAGRRPARTRSGRRSSRRRCGRRGRLEQRRDELGHLSMCRVARGRTSGVVIRSAAASARKRGEVALGELVDGLAGRGGAADDLVVDVGDVHDPGHPVPAPAR